LLVLLALIHSIGPQKLCVDGTYGVNSTHFEVSEVDIFSNHFYPLRTSILKSDVSSVEKADRVYIAGELGWSDTSGDSLGDFYDVILQRQKLTGNEVVAGSMFWSLFGRNVPDCSVRYIGALLIS
jgi:mannan endo-1,4-beta-mannosidase